jgi:flagella basal body P-ring formation protein FlgA
VSNGANFSVSSEAKSLGTAGEGQIVQVRTSSGSVVSGTAKAGGVVQVAF